MSQSDWDPQFTPSYTPKEMLELGVFEGKYINVLKGLPKSWYALPKVLGKDDDPDPSLNHFGIKSRQSLSEWRKNGWLTKKSPWGWYGWYCHYWLGKRDAKEDQWQIGRWRSFVARHQGQIVASGQLKNTQERRKQRQALLQWGWDSTKAYTPEQQKKNLDRLKRFNEVTLEHHHHHIQW